ncbi:MAG: alpha/beta hydrolase [Chloroflexi bacterium]|nr:alpha/beta hydrolase [Chloroflexota bacterium]
MSIKTDNQIKLADGRSLGYAEYGDPQGKPILYFHGCPGSRLDNNRPSLDESAARHHVRIIAPDRPGIGLSDFTPYTIVSWTDIVTEFADKLGLGRFAVLGISSGGKYAAACAWKIPQRLTAAVIMSGNCPYDLPGAKEILSKQDRQMYMLADKVPWLLRLMFRKYARDMLKDPTIILSYFNESESDKMTVARPDVKQAFEHMPVEAFRQGVRGVALDLMLEARPWGFALQEISMPVHVWHGEQDRIVPVEQGRIQAKAIPNANARYFPNEGHTLGVNQLEELLDTLVG